MIRIFVALSLLAVPCDVLAVQPLPPESVYPPRLTLTADGSSNPEMRAMMEADQAARKVATIDWPALNRADSERRKRTRAMLDAGQLKTGADYYFAAFIFQHGDTPEDYLLAHALAVAAIAKGTDARWISAATLDRYVQAVGKPQVFGTQSSKRGGGLWTQDPYDRKLVPDALRAAMDVPTQAEKDAELKARAAQ